MTNGDSIFTQTKIDKLSPIYDNTQRYLKETPCKLKEQFEKKNIVLFFLAQSTKSKVQKQSNITQQSRPSTNKPILLRSVIPKPLPTQTSSKTKLSSSNVIVLD